MRRLSLSLAVAAVCAAPVVAQPDLVPKDGKVVIPLTLQPTPTAKPLSAAYLLPEYRDSIPGNRVQMFLRCFMEQDLFFGREETEKRQKWNVMPLTEPSLAELKGYGGRLIERDMYDAARMLDADWQLWYFLRRDGIGTLLPDVQKMRALADVLKTRVRAEIAAGDHAAAIHTLNTFFGLARTMGTHPSLIGHLVGIAIATIAIGTLEELVQVTGCPNLYWSLTDLPTPFFDLRIGVQGERVMMVSHFESLLNVSGPLSDQEMEAQIRNIAIITQLEARPSDSNERAGTAQSLYKKWAADAKRVATARGRLVESGFNPRMPNDLVQEFGLTRPRPRAPLSKAEIVQAMTPLQVIVTDDVLQYEIRRDELMKWMPLPFARAKAGFKETEAALKKDRDQLILAPTLLPTIEKVRTAQVRLDQRIALARVIEAVRLHALSAGKLPGALADIAVPVPLDPVTGKDFDYAVKDGTATLHGENPNPPNPQTNRVYEIRLR